MYLSRWQIRTRKKTDHGAHVHMYSANNSKLEKKTVAGAFYHFTFNVRQSECGIDYFFSLCREAEKRTMGAAVSHNFRRSEMDLGNSCSVHRVTTHGNAGWISVSDIHTSLQGGTMATQDTFVCLVLGYPHCHANFGD